MPDRWQTNHTWVMIQEGGPGNRVKLLPDDTTVTGPSGGGQSVSDLFTRDSTKVGGAIKRQAVIRDAAPERFTFDLMTRISISKFIENLSRRECQHTLWVRNSCGVYDNVIDYEALLGYHEVFGVGTTKSENIANVVEDVDLLQTVNESASEEMAIKKVNHIDISAAEVDQPINAMISIGNFTCGCGCGAEDAGIYDYLAVTDQDDTPGYQGNPAPYLGWSQESAAGGAIDWTWVLIEDFLDGDAIDVLYAGGYVLAVSATNGVAYALYSDLLNGVATPFSLATGFTGGNFPNAIASAGAGVIWGVGDGGYIFKSTDNGQSFVEISAGTFTTEDLNDVAFANDVFGWVVGESGTVLKYENGAWSVVVVTDATEGTLTDNINKVVIPTDRQCEAYIAAAGTIWRTRDKGTNWEYLEFVGHGEGTIESIKFSGPGGHMFWAVQTDIAGEHSRVLRDFSGGGLSYAVDVVGSYVTPANSVINDIAPANLNYAATGGEVDGGFAFVGRIIPAA